MIHGKEAIDNRLRAKTPFWRGIWLSIVVAAKFLLSLGPQNWSIQKLATAGKEDPLAQSAASKPSTSTTNTLK